MGQCLNFLNIRHIWILTSWASKITATWKKICPPFSSSELPAALGYQLPPAQSAARRVPWPCITRLQETPPWSQNASSPSLRDLVFALFLEVALNSKPLPLLFPRLSSYIKYLAMPRVPHKHKQNSPQNPRGLPCRVPRGSSDLTHRGGRILSA